MSTLPISPAAPSVSPGAAPGAVPGAAPGNQPGNLAGSLLSQAGASGSAPGAAPGQPANQPGGQPGSLAGSLLSQAGAPGDAPGDAPGKPGDAPGGKPAPAMPDVAPPESPDGYTFEFAKDAAVNHDLLGEFKGIAHKLGLTGEQAQSLADFYADRALEMTHKQQMQDLLEARMRWEGEIKRSPGFAEDYARATVALKQFGSPELYELFDVTNIGAHPLMFKFLADVGRTLGESAFVGNGSGAQPTRSAASKLYPNMA